MFCVKNVSLTFLVKLGMQSFPASGEINSNLENANTIIQRICDIYKPEARNIDNTDGISIEYDDWRFNLRSSNTEPVVRLNVESKDNVALMQMKTDEILALMAEK